MLSDCSYSSTFLGDIGYDVDQIAKDIDAIRLVDRSANYMKYRGREIKRSKAFFVDRLDLIPIYSYPGFTYESVIKEYQLMDEIPVIKLLRDEIKTRFGHETNHAIMTAYLDETDTIGWHDDKVKTIDPEVPIYIFSFFQQRSLSFRLKPTEENKNPEIIYNAPMEHGSLFILGHQTNAVCQHAILPAKEKMTKRISVIFRKITNVMPRAQIVKKGK